MAATCDNLRDACDRLDFRGGRGGDARANAELTARISSPTHSGAVHQASAAMGALAVIRVDAERELRSAR